MLCTNNDEIKIYIFRFGGLSWILVKTQMFSPGVNDNGETSSHLIDFLKTKAEKSAGKQFLISNVDFGIKQSLWFCRTQ